MRFEYTYIYGAICPQRDTGEALVVNAVCKEAMEAHLEIISKTVPDSHHAVVVMDRAPWHKALKVPSNISTIYLPPYSPELNPQENIWEYLKNNFLSNVVFEDLDHVTDACCKAWQVLCNEAGRIKSIGSRSWALIN